MKELMIIHSCDSTTSFLVDIVKFLEDKGFGNFKYLKICDPLGDIAQYQDLILGATKGSTILFLGHGASHSIYLPLKADQTSGPLISKDNFSILDGKNFICLACRSSEFINQNFQADGGLAMFGFDDLPTHWADVYAEREMGNFKAYPGVTDNVLEFYRAILVNVFSNALYDALANEFTFGKFYNRFRLYVNRQMFKVTNYSISDKPSLLANMLYELREGVRLIGNPSATFL